MNRRYQVFVSSTYRDLIEQRKIVIDELNKVGYIAIGMEQFPASDEEQMDYIRPVIDESDYYVVIIKGKYGKPSTDGLSYTHKEFNYACETGKPALAFVYKNYDQLTADQIEQDPDLMRKFSQFKGDIMSKKIVRFWDKSEELVSAVKDSLTDVARRRPSVGWVRGDNAADPKIYIQLEELRNRNDMLEHKLAGLASGSGLATDLSRGADPIEINYVVYSARDENGDKKILKRDVLKSTWAKMLNFLREEIYRELSEDYIRNSISDYMAIRNLA